MPKIKCPECGSYSFVIRNVCEGLDIISYDCLQCKCSWEGLLSTFTKEQDAENKTK